MSDDEIKNDESVETGDSSKMIPAALSSFIAGGSAENDIFIKLPNGKYIKVVHKGQNFSIDRLKKYQDMDIEFLYMDSKDYGVHVEKCINLASVISESNLPQEKKMEVISKATEAVFQELDHSSLREDVVLRAQVVTNSLVKSVSSNQDLSALFEKFNQLHSDFVKHSAACSAISTCLAINIGWAGDKSLKLVSLGGLLHDIGLKEIDPNIPLKKRSELEPEEVRAYESHPTRGMQILTGIPGLPAELISIVYEHHELPGGRGFPRGLPQSKIYPLARLVSLADLIAHQTIKTKRNPEPKSVPQAVEFLKTIHSHNFPPAFWRAADKLSEEQTLGSV